MHDPQRILRFSNANAGDARLRLAAFGAGYRRLRTERAPVGQLWPLAVWGGDGDFGLELRLLDCVPMFEPLAELQRAIQVALFVGRCPLCGVGQHLIDERGIVRRGGVDRVTIWPFGMDGLWLCLPHAEGCLAAPRSLRETADAIAC